MTPKRKKRLALILLMVTGVAIAAGFALKAFNENLMFFYQPSQVIAGEVDLDRLGRCVVTIDGSELARGGGGCRCMTMPIGREPPGGPMNRCCDSKRSMRCGKCLTSCLPSSSRLCECGFMRRRPSRSLRPSYVSHSAPL